MMKTILILIIAIAVIVISSVVLVGGMYLLLGALAWLWLRLTGKETKANIAPGKPVPARIPFLVHQGSITAINTLPDTEAVLTTGADKTWRISEPGKQPALTTTIPFYPGPVAVARGSEPLVAIGRFQRETSDDSAAPDLAVWRMNDTDTPWQSWQIPGIRGVRGIAFNTDATEIRTLVSIYNPDQRTTYFAVYTYDIAAQSSPRIQTIPAEESLFDDFYTAALSATGAYVACRITHTVEDRTVYHGVGVWDIAAETWKHRFGGREAEPHKIHAVTRDGETVFSAREDSPERDFRNGGPEWYDGLYIWDAASPPEGAEEAKPHAMHGSNSMVFNADESLFATPSASGAMDVFDIKKRKLRKSFSLPYNAAANGKDNAWSAAFTRDGKQLVTGHFSGEVCWWNL